MGVSRLRAHAKGGLLEFSQTTSLAPAKVIELLQEDPPLYRFDRHQTLRFSLDLKDNLQRLDFVFPPPRSAGRLKLALAVLCFSASPVVQGQQSGADEELATEIAGQASVLSADEAREQLEALPERKKLAYEVEMLIFENLEVPGLSMQKWPEKNPDPQLGWLDKPTA